MRLSSVIMWVVALCLLAFLYYQGYFEFIMDTFGKSSSQYNAPSDETRYAITFLLQTASNNPGTTLTKKGVVFKKNEFYDETLMAGVGPGTLSIQCIKCSGTGTDLIVIREDFTTETTACCDAKNNCKLGIGVNVSC